MIFDKNKNKIKASNEILEEVNGMNGKDTELEKKENEKDDLNDK